MLKSKGKMVYVTNKNTNKALLNNQDLTKTKRIVKVKQERKKVMKRYIQLFFVLALIMCFTVWANTGFRDLRKPYINVYCPKDDFRNCINPYYEHCKMNDCSYLDPNIYTNRLVKVGESIGEQPPFTLFTLPTALTVLGIMLTGLGINEIKKNEKKNKRKKGQGK